LDLPANSTHESSRNLYAFGTTSFLNDTVTEMAYWVLPAFLSSIGAGPAQLGFIEGIAESVASLLLSGYLADRISRRKPVVVVGYLVANAVKPLLAVTSSWRQVLAIRFADRFAKGIRDTPRDVMVADSVESSRIGSAYGLVQAMDSAGAIAGPLIALLLLTHCGLRGVFWAAGVPGLFCVLVSILGIREVESTQRCAWRDPYRKGETQRTPSVRFCRHFYFVLMSVTLFAMGNSSDMFLVLRAQRIGIPTVQAPLLGLVFKITYTLFSWPAGKFSDRFSRQIIAAMGYLVFAVVCLIFAIAPSRSAIWMAMAFYGLFYALTNPVVRALVLETVSPEVRGRALGIYFFVTSVTTLLASVITGELWSLYGPGLPFCMSAGIALVCAMLLLLPSTARSGGATPKQKVWGCMVSELRPVPARFWPTSGFEPPG
jgi:MFS family permease